MTCEDPFGNYLCQKLLEQCNDDQRLAIVTRVAPVLIPISLSEQTHGAVHGHTHTLMQIHVSVVVDMRDLHVEEL